MAVELQRIADLGAQLRVDSIRCTRAAGSGHPTSSMSAADLMAVLMVKYLRYDWDHPENPANDRLIFSKGHASPLLYSIYKAAGVITDEELLTLRKFGSRLEGHPKPLQSAEDRGAPHGLPWVDVATGSLGQGLPIGIGMALSGKCVDRLPFHVWVLLGDSEMAEGSNWEAFDKAGHYELNNDQIRMAAISDANLCLCGSHAGVSIGEDGPSQMALEDLAMMRAVHGSTVLYPCDANQTAHLVNTMAGLPGISYLRTTRANTPIIYSRDEPFPIGGSKVVRHSDEDQVAIIAAGITLHESLRAYEQLNSEGILVRVIDAYSVKPIDKEALHQAAQATGGRLVVVEDHWSEGGIGDAVLDAFVGVMEKIPTVVKLAVRSIPTSGTPAQPLSAAGIDAEHIARAVRARL